MLDRPKHHPQDLARHDGKILHARHMVDAERDPHHQIGIDDAIAASSPRAHARAAARLVRVLAAGVELAVAVAGDVEIVVSELGALVVEALRVGEEFLEGGGVDLVGDGEAVDGVADRGVLDLEGPVGVVVGVEAAGLGHHRFAHRVARALRVQRRARHRVRFVVDEAVGVPVDGRVDAQREDVLVVGGEDAGVDDGAPGDGEAGVDGLGAEDAGGTDFVDEVAGLVEHEGEDVFVVGDGDDALDDELAVAHDGGSAGAVVGVLPADAGVLFVHAHDVLHGRGFSFVVREDGAEVVDRAETVAAKFQVVGHYSCSGISEVEGCFSVERRSWIGVWNVHIRERETIEQAAPIIADLQL